MRRRIYPKMGRPWEIYVTLSASTLEAKCGSHGLSEEVIAATRLPTVMEYATPRHGGPRACHVAGLDL